MRGLLLSLSLCAGCLFAQPTRSALEADAKGWKDILPAPSMKGWTRVAIPPTQPLSAETQWSVDTARKLLVCSGDKGHEWLRFDTEMADAIFHVEFRYTVVPDGPNVRYNSGVYGRNNADGTFWHQAQIGASSGGYFFGVTQAGTEKKRFNFQDKNKPSLVKPAGEWNTLEITAKGKKMTLWVNGEITSEWDNLELTKGYFGLEAEGYRIEFRNVKIKTL